jgi:pantothenate kinase
MASFVKYYQFVENLAKGVHNFTSDASCTVTVALSNTVGDIAQTNATLSQITQISYANCSSRVVTNITAEQTTGTLNLIASNDLVLTASGVVGPFQYVILYDDDPTSPADPLIGCYNYGSAVTLQDTETFTINFDQVNGILTVA